MTSQDMRHAIMTSVKANKLPVTGDFWLMLAFRTDYELKSMCQELNIIS